MSFNSLGEKCGLQLRKFFIPKYCASVEFGDVQVIVLRAFGRCWGELSDDCRYREVRRAGSRVARIDLVLSAGHGRPVLVKPPMRESVSVETGVGDLSARG